MKKEELRQELEKFRTWYYGNNGVITGTFSSPDSTTIDRYLSSLEPKQPELKGISEAFQNFTNELKSMGL